MMCPTPITTKNKLGQLVTYPCGKCMACRINYTTSWVIRLEYERLQHEKNAFVTLTYDDEHLPKDQGLHKKDLQDFIKRFRYYLSFLDVKDFKYYAVGEYGEQEIKYWFFNPIFKHGRPHYHILMFGVDSRSPEVRHCISQAWNKCEKELIENPYHKGVGDVTADSIRYVADYMQKKQYGKNAAKEYGFSESPFSLSSQGLGLSAFLQENISAVKDTGYINYNGRKCAIPRYFKEKIDFIPIKSAEIKNPYRDFCLNHKLLSEWQIKHFDEIQPKIRYNVYLDWLLSNGYKQELDNISETIKQRNNLYRNREL